MNTRLDSTASSCGVMTSGIRLTAPRVPWMVSSSVKPVSTRVVIVFSASVNVAQDWMSLDSGTFSGNQKLLVNRSQTSRSLGSSISSQLIAYSGLMMSCLRVLVVAVSVMSAGVAAGAAVLSAARGSRGGLSERATDAVLHLCARQRLLPQADVVEGLDALAPGVDVRPVQVPGGDRVLEEQREAQALVHVLGSSGVGVDDLLVADLIGVLEVLDVVVGQVRRGVVHPPDLAFLADLHRGRDRVDQGGGCVDVGDRPGRAPRLQALVVDPLLNHRVLQRAPVVLGGDVHPGVGE